MGNNIVEDELSREWRQRHLTNAKRMTELGGPASLIEESLRMSKMTYMEAEAESKRRSIEKEAESEEYCKNNPMLDEHVKLIHGRFDLWFEKYKNNSEMLEDELMTGHNFHEPWYWGNIPMGAENEFYEDILTMEDWQHGNYSSVFEACRTTISERLNELG
jgi:hypothetical protein